MMEDVCFYFKKSDANDGRGTNWMSECGEIVLQLYGNHIFGKCRCKKPIEVKQVIDGEYSISNEKVLSLSYEV